MGFHQILVTVVALALASVRAEFPSRTDSPTDCPEADQGCWCRGSFAQCWRTYEEAGMTGEIGNRITKLDLLYQPSEEIVTYIRRSSAMRELRISEDGVSLDCSCDLIYALDDKHVTLVDQAELTFSNCQQRGWPRDSMTARSFVNRCHVSRMQDGDLRKRRESEDVDDDDVSKRASPRKGDEPAGHTLKDLAPQNTNHLVSIDGADKHPADELVNFISGHSPTRRATDNDAAVSDDSKRGARKKRYVNTMGYPQAMSPQMGGVNYGQPAQQGYGAQGMGGPVGGGPMGGPPQFGALPPGQADTDFGSSSSSVDGGDTTISARVMDDIKAVLGATKIDLPVDINDPYDLGLLLRHLRHHSNLLANIGDPAVREQVLSAMQEEEEEEEEDAATGAQQGVLNGNAPGQAGFGGGGGGGAMMSPQQMGGQPQGMIGQPQGMGFPHEGMGGPPQGMGMPHQGMGGPPQGMGMPPQGQPYGQGYLQG
ncbi:bindin precursor [Strongylocentrotus purpuratus]|uniref:Bindin n=2 Tax=Strongylocentrotus purpuratus TaxID=7668 RepID=BIND_STRPU|nr:bindin precursor [Strongylocentrotus purpuratus]P06651.1 RecName: Full=Bindin; Flags: Precursor [Strongylocentrotus purpuratus]AAA30038.1 bindin [Strongylocentrotus purpuratus]|eukprot:NP_999683.1 bindin precursor [Strongylocentrotus purpuratus]